MPRAILIAAVVALCAAASIAPLSCRPITPAAAEEFDGQRPLRIVATIRPLELIVRELLDDPDLAERFEISAIMAPEVSPHGFEPTAAQMARLRRADVVIYNGLGLDDWAVRDLPRNVRAVCFADVVDLDADHHHHHDDDHEHGPECNHGPLDEHFWVDPELTGAFATSIVVELARVLSASAGQEEAMELLEAPLQRFLARVRDVDAHLSRSLSVHKGRRIVTHHSVYPRLAERYGLGEPIVLRPLAVLEPTPGDLRRAIEAIRAERIGAILVEPQFSADAARRVQEETRVRLIEVDPLGTGASSWSDLMHGIGEAIVQSLRAG